MGNRFYQYYMQLPQKEYERELTEQINVLLQDGRRYNLTHPVTFNDKIQWLKIWDCTPIKTKLADKFAVREWIAEQIGDEYLIPLVGGPWKQGEDIDFDALPERFVLKSNHATGDIIIVKNKGEIDRKKIIKTVNHWMKVPFGWAGLEAQYLHIPPRIFAEEYVEQSDGNLYDYKIYCHNGEPVMIQTIGNRDLTLHKAQLMLFDTDWNKMGFSTGAYPEYQTTPDKPECLGKMLEIARLLSKGFIFVSVDLYQIDGQIRFGEMTFTPSNGMLRWNPPEANLTMGNLLKLPCEE